MSKFYYSYVMGVDDNILKLRDEGFCIEKKGNDYLVTFPQEKAIVWEEFIYRNLESGFWNDYIGDDIVFIFKFDNGVIKKYILDSLNENEILELCCRFAETKFNSIKDMLLDNDFYKDKV